MTKRLFLFLLGLAKLGRGRFSDDAEAVWQEFKSGSTIEAYRETPAGRALIIVQLV